MIKQLGFVLDPNHCLGCGACVKACQTQHHLPEGTRWRNLRNMEEHNEQSIRYFFLSTACNHCASPECMRVCPNGAYSKRRDGIVTHIPERCTSCKSCIAACPFGAPVINPLTGKAGKCQLCAERLDQNLAPFCITACPTRALRLVEIQNATPVDGLVRLTAPLPSLRLTRPSVFYHSPRRTQIG